MEFYFKEYVCVLGVTKYYSYLNKEVRQTRVTYILYYKILVSFTVRPLPGVGSMLNAY